MVNRQEFGPRTMRREDFVIGDWRVRPDCNRVVHRRLGVERRLEPRLMHLFGLLAANAGETLSREQLNDELWPRVIVTDNSLTRAISALRKSLVADGGNGGVKIETVPKKGYRLVLAQSPGEKSWSRALPWQALAAPALALAVIAGGWLGSRESTSGSPYPATTIADFGQEFMPVNSDGLAGVRQEAPVLSTDGGRYAFIRHDAAGSTIWLGDLRGGGEAVAVYSSGLPLANLVWSPAGNALLFARHGTMTAEAVYGGAGAAQLMQIDLTSWTVSSLTPEAEEMQPQLPAEIDLT